MMRSAASGSAIFQSDLESSLNPHVIETLHPVPAISGKNFYILLQRLPKDTLFPDPRMKSTQFPPAVPS
jgi:hypothetical protein